MWWVSEREDDFEVWLPPNFKYVLLKMREITFEAAWRQGQTRHEEWGESRTVCNSRQRYQESRGVVTSRERRTPCLDWYFCDIFLIEAHENFKRDVAIEILYLHIDQTNVISTRERRFPAHTFDILLGEIVNFLSANLGIFCGASIGKSCLTVTDVLQICFK